MRSKFQENLIIPAVLCGATLCTPFAWAGDTFTAELFVDGAQSDRPFSKIEELFAQTQPVNILQVSNNYTDDSFVLIGLDIRGVDALVRYPANTTEIQFEVPRLDFSRTFEGGSRDQSQLLFDTFIKENGDQLLSDMLRLAVAETPIDPVAGNPNSLMGEMVSADFFGNTGTADERSNKETLDKDAEEPENSIFIGLNASRFTIDGHDQDIVTLPLAYTYYFEDPQYQLRLNMPITYMTVNDSKAYRGSFGAAFRIPVNRDWSLTPALRVGAIGSEDLGAAALMYSGTLTSNYNFYWEDYRFSLGNMIGMLRTGDVDAGDYNVSYGLSNRVFKNGLAVEAPSSFKLFDRPTSWRAALTHTKFTGDKLFIDQYMDLAVSFGHREKLISKVWDDWRLGLTYTAGDNDYKSMMVNFGYKF